MTMLAVGRGLRGGALRGMGAVTKAEAVENQQRLALETAQQQQENATMGTGAGIGGMVGANRMMDASKAANAGIDGINTALDGYGTASRSMTGTVKYTPAGEGATTLTGDAAVSAMENTALGIDGLATDAALAEAGTLAETGAVAAEAGTLAAEAGTLAAEAGAVAETGVAVGEATAAVNAGTAATASAGPMAQLATMASPIAIGLGVAFLLNKLFD